MQPEAFRQKLQQELLRRIEKNPSYSLRAFSNLLEVDSASLSQMLRGKRKLSEKACIRFSEKLGWNPLDIRSGIGATVDPSQYRNLTLDAFNVISDWYHFAITQLIYTKNFQQDPAWIAQRLGITRNEVNIAIERLIALEIVQVDKKGRWKCAEGGISTLSTPHSAAAFRKMQKQILEKAMGALEEVPIDERDQTSISFPMNPKRLTEAKDLAKEFRRKMCALMSSDTNCTEVYQLSVSLFPLTQRMKKEK